MQFSFVSELDGFLKIVWSRNVFMSANDRFSINGGSVRHPVGAPEL
jgi:hypothetical protein